MPNTMALTRHGKKITERANSLARISRSAIVSAKAITKVHAPPTNRIFSVLASEDRKAGSSNRTW